MQKRTTLGIFAILMTALLLFSASALTVPTAIAGAGLPDLTVTTRVTFDPAQAAHGDRISVDFTVKNRGDAASGSFHLRVSLSTHQWGTLHGLGNFPVDSLGPGASRTLSITTNAIPSAIPAPGHYYVTVFVDGFKQVTESNEDNNIGTSTPSRLHLLAAPPPDPTITSAHPSPSTAAAGETITITYNVANPGPTRTVLLGASIQLPGISPLNDPANDRQVTIVSGSSTVQRSFVIPADAPPGRYNLLVSLVEDVNNNRRIDAGDRSLASRTFTGTLQVTPPAPPPDPTITSAHPSPSTAAAGETITITYNVANPGPTRTVLLGASIQLPGRSPLNDPANDRQVTIVSGSSTVQRSFVIPADAPPGSYNLLVSLVEDVNNNGRIDPGDRRLAMRTFHDALDVTYPVIYEHPVIHEITPSSWCADDIENAIVRITGQNLGTSGSVLFGYVNPTIRSWTDTEIIIEVPINYSLPYEHLKGTLEILKTIPLLTKRTLAEIVTEIAGEAVKSEIEDWIIENTIERVLGEVVDDPDIVADMMRLFRYAAGIEQRAQALAETPPPSSLLERPYLLWLKIPFAVRVDVNVIIPDPIRPGIIFSNTEYFTYQIRARQLTLASPGELRVYDSEGRVTGLVDGKVKQEIPYSMYDAENRLITIFYPTGIHYLEVAGTEEATYGLTTISVMEGQTETFAITDVPTTETATHRFVIDPEVPVEAGVTMKTDADGDGVFEEQRILHQPRATFTFCPEETIVDQPITFDASGSSDPDGQMMSYEWDFGDGTTGTGKVVEHSFSVAGDYMVTLTIGDNDGVINSFSKRVVVVLPQAPDIRERLLDIGERLLGIGERLLGIGERLLAQLIQLVQANPWIVAGIVAVGLLILVIKRR